MSCSVTDDDRTCGCGAPVDIDHRGDIVDHTCSRTGRLISSRLPHHTGDWPTASRDIDTDRHQLDAFERPN